MTGPQDDQTPPRTRLLADLIAEEAPLPVARAASIMSTVGRQLLGAGSGRSDHGALTADRVLMHEDGTVTLVAADLTRDAVPAWAPTREIRAEPVAVDAATGTDAAGPSAAGASIGRLLFALLIGRQPLDRSDAFEPAITAVLTADDCALLARSCSDAPGQWPSVDEWTGVLARLAGGAAAPLSPGERRRSRVRTVLVSLGVVLLAAITVTVLLLAPSWWDAANERPQTSSSSD